ncbi:Filamentous growth regulator 27 [Candida viswanathii]|uniref:Filamentous growth regulator 27 n=1 Tax=Candida viswanathii TaxID=5486 RepID=A0A367Y0S1_9ASCO|nr:Filamentous growth regulator 27 [Candida viswanathii]
MERRTKVSRACDYCKKRKYKCSGVPPCNLCLKKQIDCIFSIVDRRTTKGSSKIQKPTEYIPKNLQPLLSFPVEDNQVSLVPPPPKQTQHEHGKNLRLLYDKDGKLRYVGESSPLSLSFEARKIFLAIRGESDFTNDPDNVNIIDAGAQINPAKVLQLPKKEDAMTLVNIFDTNINQTWYIYNRLWLLERLSEAYEDPLKITSERMAAFHLIFSLGLLFAEKLNLPIAQLLGVKAVDFFESGYELIRNVLDDGRVWMTETSLLMYFYYQSTSRRSLSWMMLGNAIRNAQALGLHRKAVNDSFSSADYVTHRKKLWKTLYTCDRISSILLGRPLTINDYDWDDVAEGSTCHDENTKIAKILGNIVQNFYQNGTVNILRAEKIAIELKKWSINLPSEIQIDKILDNYSILFVHILQLYGIMLLGRPFFMYLLFKRNQDIKQEKVLKNFCGATIKAAVLTIQVIHIYTQHNQKRVELYVTANCCLKASLIIGLTILYRQTNPDYEHDEFSTDALLQQLYIAKSILYFYSSTSTIADRFHSIVSRLVRAVQPEELSLPIPTPFQQGETSRMDSTPPEYVPFENIINFQQFFVPSTTNSEGLEEFMYYNDMNDLLFNGSSAKSTQTIHST